MRISDWSSDVCSSDLDVISSSYQTAQMEQGIFNPRTVSVGDLFAGALVPGLVLVGLYILFQIATALLRPESSPAMPADEATKGESRPALYRRLARVLVAPRSEEHTSELQSLMRISDAVFCLQK